MHCVYIDDVQQCTYQGAPPKKRRIAETVPEKIASGMIAMVGAKKVTQTGAVDIARLYATNLGPVLQSADIDLKLPHSFHSLKRKAGIDERKGKTAADNPHKGVVHDMCTYCFHVFAQEDAGERDCPVCEKKRTTLADGTPLQCLLFDVRRQITDMMGNYEGAKSHHYAAEFREEGDGDIWDGNVLKRWTTEKRYIVHICIVYVLLTSI